MFKTIRRNIKQYIIAGIMLAFIAPALPARAADNAAVDTTASQTATSGEAVNSGNGTVPPVDQVTPVTPINTNNTPVAPVCGVSAVMPVTPVAPVDSEPSLAITTNASVSNCIDSDAGSGDASVSGNGTAGNATSGSADVAATLLNLIQSTTGLSANGLATFTTDIYGNSNGYNIDPSVLMALAAQNAACGCNALMQAYLNANINNDVNLNASSGNASVVGNGSAGNATTGDANAMANIVNIINSITNASQAFVGVINIYGDLNGDILLPAGWYDSLIGSDPGNNSCSPNCSGGGQSNSNMGILNNINLTAITGDASVINNGLAGDASTGNAATKLNIINLINKQITGGNVLLVFVNVLGKWVGLLMDAPAGSTTATLGGNIGENNSNCGCQGGTNLNAQITNNINLTARSGDALVGYNGEAGDATSGNATASLNLANIINSQFSLSGWLGILFINVFGTWNGNLASAQLPQATTVIPVIIVPAKSVKPASARSVNITTISNDEDEKPAEKQPEVLGSLTNEGGNPPAADGATSLFMPALAASGMICCAFLGALDRRNSKKQHQAVQNFQNISI